MASNVKTVDLSNTSSAYYAAGTVTEEGRLLHIAGQPGSTKDGTVPDDYESQIHLSLFNLRKIIIAAGASVEDIAKLNILIVNYDAGNRKHTRHVQKFLSGHRPAITLIPVHQLAVPSWLVEIDAVVALPKPRLPPVLPQVTQKVDVIVIGAGLAGLTAAEEVLRAGKSCVVLEARDRVGGKTWSTQLDGGQGTVDLGAAWINNTNQTQIYALAKRFGADLIEQNTQGNAVLQDFDGSCSPFPYGELPNFDESTRSHLAEIRDMCEADCQALDTWRPRDTSLDSLTLEAYLRSRGASEVAIATASIWTRAMLGQDPRDISALYFLNYCKSGGGLLQMRSDRKGGGQHLRVRQGTQIFALGLESSLPSGTVKLSSPVHSITQDDQSVKVHASAGVYAGRKLITTVPTPALKNMSFHPELPPAKKAWIQSTSYGYYTKAMLQFKSPFWIERGFCGLAQSFIGPASVVRDTSSTVDHKYILTCFMAGDHGLSWSKLSTKDREEALLKQLEQLYGALDLASIFIQMTAYDWIDDEWSGRGCPSTALSPGVLDTLGGDTLRESWRNIHFAGTETAGEWKGYMEGAVRSGQRAAIEVLKGLDAGMVARL
ncbi:hypothetical protein BDV27DRAFT_152044 [Aspergillus caelatus]|uniref:Amine oxidase n=1 Tax=Aspergillus caelatus TaxID=61420 RepID=A0A5N7AN87_9EURO|nr:uncharacterized protein BDV27DRAFT_152044 [Aspergillus caelatus]KAE8370449.1 hypothetical protein BDV27DRAFT_152044 [Aspergillus caelatus]